MHINPYTSTLSLNPYLQFLAHLIDTCQRYQMLGNTNFMQVMEMETAKRYASPGRRRC
jgi:hypothetical protein